MAKRTSNSNPILERVTDENFEEIWCTLTRSQQRFCIAMTTCKNKTEAGKLAGIKDNTIYSWGSCINPVIDYMSLNKARSAMAMLEAGIILAVDKKIQALNSRDEKISQGAATEIINKVLGKDKQTNTRSNDDTVIPNGFTINKPNE